MRFAVMAIEESRAATSADLGVLVDAARRGTDAVRSMAIRALGRLQRRSVIPVLLAHVASERDEAALALALAFRGEPLDGIPLGQQEQAALDVLLPAGYSALASRNPGSAATVARILGRIPYATLDQAESVEAFLKSALQKWSSLTTAHQSGAAEGLASLGRVSGKLMVRFLLPLLKDIDAVVADAAAKLLYAWTGKAHEIETKKRVARGIPPIDSTERSMSATFEIDNGKNFHVSFNSDRAPLARARFVALAAQGFYDGLTFHRVFPNAYVQGGSPGASEYCGDCPFLSDEIGPPSHVRGTIGMSNRGPDLGDGQFFVSLVDNLAFDDTFTVLGFVSDLSALDEIQEGDRIIRVAVQIGKPRARQE